MQTNREIVADEEIISYDWDKHVFHVKFDTWDRFYKDESGIPLSKSKLLAQFGLSVGNVVVYRLTFLDRHYQILSQSPAFLGVQDQVFVRLPRGRGESIDSVRRTIPDVRNNRRLFLALQRSGRLIND